MSEIVAAAVQYRGLTISLPRPNRHHHILHLLPMRIALTCSQGFIDSNGDFLDRKQAKLRVKETGQPTIADHQPRELFSEDLW